MIIILTIIATITFARNCVPYCCQSHCGTKDWVRLHRVVLGLFLIMINNNYAHLHYGTQYMDEGSTFMGIDVARTSSFSSGGEMEDAIR